MREIRIQCPAKINLTLKIVGKRDDGFHNIESIMQTINLFDYLSIKISDIEKPLIKLSGSSNEIPYNENNLVYKATKLFLETINNNNTKVEIFIEKNIPVAAGLAGGSTDAAGTLYGLNKLFDNILSIPDLHKLCSKLGSDLNFCLEGGTQLTTGRGEILTKQIFKPINISLIKPLDLGISAKEAYMAFAQKSSITQKNRNNFANDLEWAIIDNYPELQLIKNLYPKSIMSGSGSTYFIMNECFNPMENYLVINNLHTINFGVKEY